jgi:dnd system-associated protein 4
MKSVRRDLKHEPLVRQLAETVNPSTKRSLFPTMRELLCFAAALGFQFQRRMPLGNETAELDGRTIENLESAVDMIYLVGIAGSRDVGILQPDREDELVKVFEEYANGGLQILKEWLHALGSDMYGDQAILSAFRREELLTEGSKPLAKAIADVVF